ncbi:GNAT family acetyltransferase [Cypionkella aquatica]|uniref:GNAT family acetyltransferase n=1 Tax=Cypionkella aquatica TaxID=1756042 RepID=A0AA37TUH5_9RHOB|nr:GNAT family N-acetyltransferase [Cypionkella aquatica]GLS86010.1 GNAT family acetyltransferase [Cypionkella aquatica]
MIIRPALPTDAAAMSDLQNRIIRIGGTTAHEVEHDAGYVEAHYITGPGVICCHLAEDDSGLIGFQSLGRNAALADDWGDIGSYVNPDRQRTGAGAALFAATLAVARAKGLVAINATIRGDNVPGLGYYSRRGFVDYAHDAAYRLKDGRVVGRVSKRFEVSGV